MGFDDHVRRLGWRLRGMPGFGVLERLYPKIADPLVSWRTVGSPFPHGFYEVSIDHDVIDPFYIWVESNRRYDRKRLRGVYEQPVMEAVADRLNTQTVFWEVGVAAGYFSLAAATISDKVVAFDANASIEFLEAVDENGFENIEFVQGTVGEDVDLGQYETPDIVTLDIEGWEYQTLSRTPELLDEDITWLIEIHDHDVDERYYEGANPTGVLSLLEDAGYDITEIHRRNEANYNILAERRDS